MANAHSNAVRPGATPTSEQVIAALLSPHAYAEAPETVELIETHISWVFLTDRFAYKLKKPVLFDFLDFSTVELRRQACHDELILNRRLAAEVYLGVVPLAQSPDGRLDIGGDGTVVDWLVKMKRLPAGCALDVPIRTGESIPPRAIDRVAEKLAAFYEGQPPVATTGEAYRNGIEQHVKANHRELADSSHGLDRHQIQRIHSAQLRFLKASADELDQRVAEGRIVEGHGDLRPEHVYLLSDPVVIDCIEFRREFRTLDIADELAFLSMECALLGAGDLVEPVFHEYTARSGDRPGRELLDFYRLYRACVRAKVTAIRAEQLAGEDRQNCMQQVAAYLQLAERYARSLGPPVMIMVHGVPGTGKSTVAEALREELGGELLQSDAIRRELFGPGEAVSEFNQGRYSEANRNRVYEVMHRRAAALLNEGVSVILDATYLAVSRRSEAARLAERNGAVFLPVHCHCPRNVALERIDARHQSGQSLSDVRPEIFNHWSTHDDPPASGESTVTIDTTADIQFGIHNVFDAIGTECRRYWSA